MTPTEEIKNEPIQTIEVDSFLTNLLGQYPQLFDSIIKNKHKYRVKIIYTQIDRKANNAPVFTNHYFNADPAEYHYPASTVKMPIAVLALQKLNELNIPGLNKYTSMMTENGYPGQRAIYNDPSTEDGRPTIAHYVKQIFLVSDNEAANRLYEFLGQEYLNNTLHKMGYDSVQIVHRLNISLTEDQNRHTNPVKFYDATSKLIYQQPLVKSNLLYQSRKTFLGKGYYSGNKLVNQPFDFSKKNRLSLPDLHSILTSIIFPGAISDKLRFNLTEDDYNLLYKYMSMKPRESKFPEYDSTYSDAYSKFLMYGGKGTMDDDIRSFNKEGDAYGFLTDAAYIVDFKNNVEFLLSATIYCNSDEIFNDDHYDYDTVGLPFLKNLGRVIYEYELKRTKKNIPDLTRFKFDYTK